MIELLFSIDIEDDWPPARIECLYFSRCEKGYRLETAPFFIKGMSVGDIIEVRQDENGLVNSWSHVCKSGRTTVWVKIFGSKSIESTLNHLKKMSCNIESLAQYNYYSVDVPECCSIEDVEECLEEIGEDDIAVAYPSFRHEDE